MTDEKLVYIYGLVDPITETVMYVGKAVNPNLRLKQHIAAAKKENSPVYNWIRQLQCDCRVPSLSVLECIGESGWSDCEKKWISKLRQENDRLLNVTDGGSGLPCVGENREYMLAKMSKAAVLRWQDETYRNAQTKKLLACAEKRIGVPRSEETRIKIGNGNRGEKCGNAKLHEIDIIEIRNLYATTGVSMSDLATKYGVGTVQISRIVRFTRWAHVGGIHMTDEEIEQKFVLETTGQKRSADTRWKMSEAAIKRSVSGIPRKKRCDDRSGIVRLPHTDETKEKIGVAVCGSKNGMCKLDESKVLDIRARWNGNSSGYEALASEYGVSSSSIRKIVQGKAWTHV